MKAARVICQQIFSIFVLAIVLLKFLLEKCVLFFLTLASRSHCGDAISDAAACSSMVFRNSVSADRIVVAASRLLGAAAACVILFSSAAGSCK